MDPHWYSVIDMAIVGVPVIGFGIWQLVSVNREIAKDRAKAAQASEDRTRHPVGEHGLDDGRRETP